MDLSILGWDSAWAAAFAPYEAAGLAPARVAIQHNHIYTVLTSADLPNGLAERHAEAAGKLRHTASGAHELPAVGDWVAVRVSAGTALMEAVLPRRSKFSRQASGRTTKEQICAANIDTVLLVTSLDNDYSPRRIERYLVLAWESGAAPVIVLNKADLCREVESRVGEMRGVAAGVPIHLTSALLDSGVADIRQYLAPGRTVALLGSSGVGKSTLINRLLGADVLPTQPVRRHDGRGRHTTTRRQLLLLPGGGMVIDTPGMRELQLLENDEGLHVTFDEIQSLGAACHFADCTHRSEPGCAVRQAVEKGQVEAERLASFHRLQRELEWLERRQDTSAALAEKRKWKTIHKAAREFYRRGE